MVDLSLETIGIIFSKKMRSLPIREEILEKSLKLGDVVEVVV